MKEFSKQMKQFKMADETFFTIEDETFFHVMKLFLSQLLNNS